MIMWKHKVFWALLTDALLLFHIHLQHWSLWGINELCLQWGITSSHVGRKQFPRPDPSINAKLILGICSSLWVGAIHLLFPKDHYIRDGGEDPNWKSWFKYSTLGSMSSISSPVKGRRNHRHQRCHWHSSSSELFSSPLPGMEVFRCLCSPPVLWLV